MKSMLFKILLLVLGILLVLGVMSLFDLPLVISHLMSVNIYLIVLAFLVQICIFFLLSLRLWTITKKYSKISFKKVFKICMIGWFVNMITPVLKIGGEPAKIYLLSKKMKATNSSAAVMVDSFLDLSSMYFIVAITLATMILTRQLLFETLLPFLILLAVTITLLALVIFTILNRRFLGRIMNFLVNKASRFVSLKKIDYAGMFQRAAVMLFKDKKLMTKVYSIAFCMRGLEFLRMWIVFLALSQFVPFHVIIFAWSIIIILAIVPWLPGGLGLLEAGGASAFLLFGISSGIAGSGVIIDRFISFWFILIVGFTIVWREGLKINVLTKR